MSRLSPQLLIVTCNSLVAAFERRSRLMRALAVDLTFTPEIVDGVPGKSWDVAFIDHCGYWSHFDERSGTSAWPVPEGLDARALGLFGAEAGLLRDDPEEGDIFLQYASHRKAFVHAGVVSAVLGEGTVNRTSYVDLATIEGDTDHAGRLRGGRAMRMNRRQACAPGDCYLRWTEIDGTSRPLTDDFIRRSA